MAMKKKAYICPQTWSFVMQEEEIIASSLIQDINEEMEVENIELGTREENDWEW